MSNEQLNVYIVKVDKASQPTQVEEWILIIQGTVIHTGTWMTSVEDYIQGLIAGLEIANLNPNPKIIEVYDDEQYKKVSRGDIDIEALAALADL